MTTVSKEDYFNQVIHHEEFFWDLYGHNLFGNAVVGMTIIKGWEAELSVDDCVMTVEAVLCMM